MGMLSRYNVNHLTLRTKEGNVGTSPCGWTKRELLIKNKRPTNETAPKPVRPCESNLSSRFGFNQNPVFPFNERRSSCYVAKDTRNHAPYFTLPFPCNVKLQQEISISKSPNSLTNCNRPTCHYWSHLQKGNRNYMFSLRKRRISCTHCSLSI